MTRALATSPETADPHAFWDRFGSATVSRLGLPAGAAVLDLCCGSGAAALPAARAVGARGRVLGIDLAVPALRQARLRAALQGLGNVGFRSADATRTGLPDGCFDAVTCVFGVYFAPDHAAFAREMWRLVAPGGVLALTTWGPGLFEPADGCFWRCAAEIEPGLSRPRGPGGVLTTPAAMTGLLTAAGVNAPRAVAESGRYPLPDPDRFWDMVIASGYRSTVDALRPDQRARLRARLAAELRARAVTHLRTDVVFGTARR